MNAQTTWNLWRRILRDDALQSAIFESDFARRAPSFGLDEEQTGIALAYARTPKQTRWNIETYRFRSCKVVVAALSTGAPLTWRLLVKRGHDPDALAAQYLATVDWLDDGPYTYRTCAGMLTFLQRAPQAADDPELQTLIHFESTTVALIRRWAGSTLHPVSSASIAAVDDEQAHFVQSGRGVMVHSDLDLTVWLGAPDKIGVTALDARKHCFLRFIPSSHEAPALITLRERGRLSYELLATPRSVGELARLLDDSDASAARNTVRRFTELGVVEPIASQRRDHASC